MKGLTNQGNPQKIGCSNFIKYKVAICIKNNVAIWENTGKDNLPLKSDNFEKMEYNDELQCIDKFPKNETRF